MPKERSINPAAAQRKADKQKEISKSKKQLQSQRNEKLARRNPDRIQRQIDELKELQQRSALRPKDQETLNQLERDLKGIRRAREALGDAAPKFAERREGGGSGARQEQIQRRQGQQLGKRRRDEEHAHDSDTDPEIRSIPMPSDTPPPIPREKFVDPQMSADGTRVPHALPSKPLPAAAPAQTVYSSAPQLRDLKKEAVKFMPAAVAQQHRRAKGEGRLLEPEEIDRLEKAGYTAANKAAEEADREAEIQRARSAVRTEGLSEAELDEETRRFEEEMRRIFPVEAEGLAKKVKVEEVEDEGD